MGWRAGRTVATAVPSHSIGGDYFGNREGLLPAKYGNYREADLDYDRGYRGASRLVFVQGRTDEGLIWVTTDHYDSFTKIYCGRVYATESTPDTAPAWPLFFALNRCGEN